MIDAIADALLPPTGLALLALALLLLQRWRAGAMALGALIALSMQGIAGVLLASLASSGVAPAGVLADALPGAIVILSGDRSAESDGMLARLRIGAALQRRSSLPILVAGGPEADAMAASLRDDFHAPVQWVATGSRNLWDSAASSAGLLGAAGISRVFVVVDEPEQKRAGRVFREAGLQVSAASVPRPDPLRLDAVALLPLTGTWLDSATAVREWAGLACDAAPACVAVATMGRRGRF